MRKDAAQADAHFALQLRASLSCTLTAVSAPLITHAFGPSDSWRISVRRPWGTAVHVSLDVLRSGVPADFPPALFPCRAELRVESADGGVLYARATSARLDAPNAWCAADRFLALPDVFAGHASPPPAGHFRVVVIVAALSPDELAESTSLGEDVSVALPAPPVPSLMPIFADLLDGAQLVDTKFVLFSRRRDGGACAPRAAYANAALLVQRSDYFAAMLASGAFLESAPDARPVAIEHTIDEYDYESDSDLDEDEDECDADLLPHKEPPHRTLRTVQVRDVAYRTWKALLLYLYTSSVTFAPLTSSPSSESHAASLPSAKSVYRAADKLGLPDLCALSLRHLEAALTPADALAQLFAPFAARHDAVRCVLLRAVFAHWDALGGRAGPAVRRWLRAFECGECPWALDAVLALMAHRPETEAEAPVQEELPEELEKEAAPVAWDSVDWRVPAPKVV